MAEEAQAQETEDTTYAGGSLPPSLDLDQIKQGDDPLIHRFATFLPPMNDGEFNGLKEDIENHGLFVKMQVYNDQILEGRNRHNALMEVDDKYKKFIEDGGVQKSNTATFKKYFQKADCKSDDDAFKLVWALNNDRRHLSVTQRALLAGYISNLTVGQTVANGVSRSEAAERYGISLRSVASAKKLIAEFPEIARATLDGRYNSLLEALSAAKNFSAKENKAIISGKTTPKEVKADHKAAQPKENPVPKQSETAGLLDQIQELNAGWECVMGCIKDTFDNDFAAILLDVYNGDITEPRGREKLKEWMAKQ